MQGDLWINKYSNDLSNDIFLPLYIFFDDLEVGNPLGSHAGINKFAAIYASIACLPPHISSRLDSIIFSSLMYSSDRVKFGNKKSFNHLIEELNFLNIEGILIKIKDTLIRVKFQLVLVLGDNLGLNQILGFIDSFNKDYFCRMCRATLKECREECVEDESKLRNRTNYEEDLKAGEINGIKEECIFHKVNGFHVTENITVDFMHDLLEGVCTYVMRNIVNTFVFEKQYFTLQTLNTRMQCFNFGPVGNVNKPPIIKIKRVIDGSTLKMSASEMLNFVKFFGIIMGDKIPETDEHWAIYKNLRQILDILLSPRIVKADAKILKTLVKNMNTLYQKYYGNLKPKFHFLIHYASILLKNGPIINFWAMRFESNHRPIKNISLSTSCKINLLTTIAIKQGLKMCQMMHSLQFEKGIKFGADNDSKVNKNYFTDEKCNNSCRYYKNVNIDGTVYDIGTFVVISMKESEIEFGNIIDIVEFENEIYFYMQVFEEVTFDFHYHAYIVSNKNEYKLIKKKDLPNIMPALSVKKFDTHFIVTRYGL